MAATAQLLRQRTAATHERVEDGLALLDPLLTIERLRGVLERLYGYWAAAEPALADWAATEPAFASSLDLAHRRRAGLLAADIELLGGTVAGLPLAASPLRDGGTAAVLGWLYVAEGSTLGGAVLRRRMRVADPVGSVGAGVVDVAAVLRTFHPYPEGPGPMWRNYLDVLERWAADVPGRSDDVADAAAYSFTVLERWAVTDAVGVAGVAGVVTQIAGALR